MPRCHWCDFTCSERDAVFTCLGADPGSAPGQYVFRDPLGNWWICKCSLCLLGAEYLERIFGKEPSVGEVRRLAAFAGRLNHARVVRELGEEEAARRVPAVAPGSAGAPAEPYYGRAGRSPGTGGTSHEGAPGSSGGGRAPN